MSSSTAFIVLYTYQKTKKTKTWHDGKLKVYQDNKANLYDDTNNHIDTLYIKPTQVYIGADLESAKYLITVDDNVKIDGETKVPPQPTIRDVRVQPAQPKSARLFSRKKRGFSVPRQINKTPDIDINKNVKETPTEGRQPKMSLFTTPLSSSDLSASTNVNTLRKNDQQVISHPYSKYLPSKTTGPRTGTMSPIERTFRDPDFKVENSNLVYNSQDMISIGNDQKFIDASEELTNSSSSAEKLFEVKRKSIGIFTGPPEYSRVQRNGCQQDDQRTSKQKDDFTNDSEESKTNSNVRTGLKRNRVQILELLGNKKKKFQVPLKQQSIPTVRVCSDAQTNEEPCEVTESADQNNDVEMTSESKITFSLPQEESSLNRNPELMRGKDYCQASLKNSESILNNLVTNVEEICDIKHRKTDMDQLVVEKNNSNLKIKLSETPGMENHVRNSNEKEDSIYRLEETEHVDTNQVDSVRLEDVHIGHTENKLMPEENGPVVDEFIKMDKDRLIIDENNGIVMDEQSKFQETSGVLSEDNYIPLTVLSENDGTLNEDGNLHVADRDQNVLSSILVTQNDCCVLPEDNVRVSKEDVVQVSAKDAKFMSENNVASNDVASLMSQDDVLEVLDGKLMFNESQSHLVSDKNCSCVTEENMEYASVKVSKNDVCLTSKHEKDNILISDEESMLKSSEHFRSNVCSIDDKILYVSSKEDQTLISEETFKDEDDHLSEHRSKKWEEDVSLKNIDGSMFQCDNQDILAMDGQNCPEQNYRLEVNLHKASEDAYVTLDDESLSEYDYQKRIPNNYQQEQIIRNEEQKEVGECFDEISQSQNAILVEENEPDLNANDSQLKCNQQAQSVNSSQETLTSTDTFDFLPVPSSPSKKSTKMQSFEANYSNEEDSDCTPISTKIQKSNYHSKEERSESEPHFSCQTILQSSHQDFQNQEAEWNDESVYFEPQASRVHGKHVLEARSEGTQIVADRLHHPNWRTEHTENQLMKDLTVFRPSKIQNTKLDVNVTNKTEGYHWKGAKCSETAKRSLKLSNIQKSTTCWSDLTSDVMRQIHQCDYHTDALDEIESATLPSASTFVLRHPEHQNLEIQTPVRDNVSKGLCINGSDSPIWISEDVHSGYEWNRHNTDRDTMSTQQNLQESVSMFFNNIREMSSSSIQQPWKVLRKGINYNLNSSELLNNCNAKDSHLESPSEVNPVNYANHPTNSRLHDAYMATPDSDSEISYLSQTDDNLFYDVVDVTKYARAAQPTLWDSEGSQLCQEVPQYVKSSNMYQNVPKEAQYGGIQLFQNIPEEVRDRQLYQSVPEDCRLGSHQLYQNVPEAVRSSQLCHKGSEDVHLECTQLYQNIPEEVSGIHLWQKVPEEVEVTNLSQKLPEEVQLRSFSQEVPASTEVYNDRGTDSYALSSNKDNATMPFNLYFEHEEHCDEKRTNMLKPLHSHPGSSSASYDNSRNLDLSTRERKPLISRPPSDVGLQSSIRSEIDPTSENASQENVGHLLLRTRTSSDSTFDQERKDSDNKAAINLTENSSNNMTLTLDQSLTDELGDFFGDDVIGFFDGISNNSTGKSYPMMATTLRFPQNKPEVVKSQESNSEEQDTLWDSEITVKTYSQENKHKVYHKKSQRCERTEEMQSQENYHRVYHKNKNSLPDSERTEKEPMTSCLEDRNSSSNNCTIRRNLIGLGKCQDRLMPCVSSVEPMRESCVKKAFCKPLHNTQMHIGGKLRFPSKEDVDGVAVPTRQTVIPVLFDGIHVYKSTLTSAIKEHLNILMFRLSQRYHQALSKVDISGLVPGHDVPTGTDASAPICQHNAAAKMVCVKKNGPNKGRFFYTCSQPRNSQCKFFLWADQYKPDNTTEEGKTKSFLPKLSSPLEMRNFMKGLGLALHCGCQLIRKARGGGFNQPNLPSWIQKYRKDMEDNIKKKLFLKLLYKDVSSTYAKDDLWVISSSLQFDPASSFIAKSIYYGPSSNMELEIEPVTGYSPSNWTSDSPVHCLLLLNASSELAQLLNIDQHVTLNTAPVLPYLMDSSYNPDNLRQVSSKAFKSPVCSTAQTHTVPYTAQEIELLATKFIATYHLNDDQGEALLQIASMFDSVDSSRRGPPVTLIHGVFGAGKSFLLSVVVLFLVQLFTSKSDQSDTSEDGYWRLLISSTTNVAVDRILLGLLDLGFEDFIRVGSLRKISKPVLPYSVHASDKHNDDVKELQEMLKSDLIPSEKQMIKRSLERQRLGRNKALLAQIKVVAVTCAASAFPCIDKLKFPVVLLDECSQMTEPASLLPIAKFHCEKLVLVGDPKQLPPTIQGSEAETTYGLEQTLFDRLVTMGINAVMLRTQYRCHPHISALSNHLFYDAQLVDGIDTDQRQPLMDDLPTLCFYNVNDGQEQCGANGSYHNLAEVRFVAALLQVVLQHGVDANEIGVITLYRAQAFQIAEFLKNETNLKPQDVRRIQISTVDAFQGGEKNVILLSCVRTDYVGFIDSYKRTNVALTRSKYHLFIIGHLGILSQNQLWGQVIELCKEHPKGIQSSKQFIKTWKDYNFDSKKTVQLDKRKAQGCSKPVEDINLTTEQTINVNDKVLDDQPTIMIPTNESVIPVDSQGSPSYSPLQVAESDLLGLESSTPVGSITGYTSPSYSPVEQVQVSDNGKDLTSLELNASVDFSGYISPSYSPLEAVQVSGSDNDLPSLELNTSGDLSGYISPSYSPLETVQPSGGNKNDFMSPEKSTPADMTDYTSPSYSPMMELSDSENDLPIIQL